LDPVRSFAPGRLVIEGESVREVGTQQDVRIPTHAQRVDLSGLIATPGFIDPHVHGGGGVDVMDGTYESLNLVSRLLARHGTTSFLPTTVSSPNDTLAHSVESLGRLIPKTFDGATPLGIHMEGPFINAHKRGAHSIENIARPDAAAFRRWTELSNGSLRLVTVAPELEGIEGIFAAAAVNGVAVGLGHSNATFAEATAAVNRGACYAVHTFNAMREFTHREPGIAGMVLADDRVFAEIIADGVHVAPAVVRMFARAKGRNRILLVSDAISATDMPDGRYMLGPQAIEVVRGICRDAEGRLAGSTLTQEIALKNMITWTDLSFEDALMGLTVNVAKALRLENKGILEPDADADVTILDESLRVMRTYVRGKLVWTNSK
jgi:N-acetylglucosamine-6-phosphate deacetylase